ncbi:unnamed protein product [Vitrella brassicaformis CCMP3155]|uniref:DsrE/DsrF-like family protein n=2 Tax=Vitrella brassicaformis TaxID=1169539 RepID=A0A0G4EGD2_VITBC|nr:unnamed protein product [Vitrella brassicaformis CCMP3155]|mmetsp:Transcript_46981/g.117144  ORF Transcript_46981/g.117144 Transcript_46981/m.117144 type:complete len:190 (+) Transcript_46981:174-743(+)|eukprot:CEL94533.1 unnamed protein product [Vitrella brassicaformis CCMP3155]
MTDIESGGKVRERTASESTDKGLAHGHQKLSVTAVVALVAIAAVAVAALIVGSVALHNDLVQRAKETATDGVMVHMTVGADEQHRVLMALSMANRMVDMGKDVIVFCDVDCPPLMAKDSENFMLEAFKANTTKDGLIDTLVARGVPIHVCPGCLAKHGLSMEDVRDGVDEVDANEFFAFTQGRMLHFDY